MFLRLADRESDSFVLRVALPMMFTVFAATDFAECYIRDRLPAWLWWTKLVVGPALFVLLNYRDHIQGGGLSRGRLAIRVIAFLVLLSGYLYVTG